MSDMIEYMANGYRIQQTWEDGEAFISVSNAEDTLKLYRTRNLDSANYIWKMLYKLVEYQYDFVETFYLDNEMGIDELIDVEVVIE